MYKSSLNKALAAMAFAVFALVSCQQEEAISPNGFNPSLSNRSADCPDCVSEITHFTTAESIELNPTGEDMWATFSHEGNVLRITVYRGGVPNDKFTKLVGTVKHNGTLIYTINDNSGARKSVTYDITLPSGATACDEIILNLTQINGVGMPNYGAASYKLRGLCCNPGFTQSGSGLTWTFCYIGEETLSNAVVRITCPHILGLTSNPSMTRIDQGVGGGDNGTVYEWIGNLTACSSKCWTVTFIPDCNRGGREINLCTNFRINEGDNLIVDGPIKYTCPN